MAKAKRIPTANAVEILVGTMQGNRRDLEQAPSRRTGGNETRRHETRSHGERGRSRNKRQERTV
ncbi:MAG TPA: hypothetical protein VIB79_13980 [Candidatus Binatia bacterium]